MKTDDELRAELHGPNTRHYSPGEDPGPSPGEGDGKSNGHAGDHAQPATNEPGPLSMAKFAGKPVPTLAYAVPLWIPLGKPVLFCGRGAAGKTTLSCQLAAARAIGAPFLGMDVPKGKSLAVLCEEDESDVHRLLAQLVDNHSHRDFAEFGDAYFWPRAGKDNALVWCDRRGQVQTTPSYKLLAEKIGDTKPDLLVLDNARHVALINENDNAMVTAAWSMLHRLMVSTATVASTTVTTTGTTLLLGHTPKNGSAEFAGGASWENVARSRLYLGPLKADADEEPIENDPRRILRRGKANASGTASLEIVWENGAFRLAHPDFATYGDRLDRDMRHGQACQAFLDALDALSKQRRNTSDGPCTRNYAPKIMKTAGFAEGFTAKKLAAAMNTLFKDGRILASQELWRGADRHTVYSIARNGGPA